MPRIPNYERQTRTPGVPGVRMNVKPDTGLGDVARGVGQVAGILSQEAVKAAEDAKSARLMDAYSQLGNARIDIEKDIGKLHGKDALEQDLAKVAREKLKTASEKIGESLPEDLQTQFRKLYLREDEGVHRTASDHFARESDAFAETSHAAAVDVATSKAASAALRSPDDPDIVAARQELLAATGERAKRKGWVGTEAEQASRAADLSTLHLTVLDRMTDAGQGATAKAYLDKYGSEIDAKARGKSNIDKVVAAAGLKDRSRVEADRIWTEADGDPAKAGELAKGITDTELFDAVDQRIKMRAGEDRSLRIAADSPREGRLETTLYRGGGLDRTSKDFQALSDEGKARVEAKRLALIRSLRSEGSQERREQAEIDRYLLATFDGSLPLRGEEGKDQVSIDIDRSDLFARGSPTVREILKTHQKKAKNELAKDQGVGRKEFLDQVTALGGRLGYDKAESAEFKAAMLDERAAWLDENPNKPNPPPEAVKKIFADSLLYGDVGGGSMWSKNRYAWQAKRKGIEGFSTKGFEEQQPGLKALEAAGTTPAAPAPPAGPAPVPLRPAVKVTSVDAIPEAERSLIVQAYKRRNGREPSGSEILQRYQLAHPEGR